MTTLLAGLTVALTAPSFANPAWAESDDTSAAADVRAALIVPQQAAMQDLLIHAISMVGVKYKYGGNSAESGFDCSGFVRHVFAESIAMELPRSAYAMGKLGATVQRDNLQPGDLVFHNTLHRAFSHVGIYLGEGRFVHAPSRGKSVEIVDMSDSYWKKHYSGARRLVEP